MPPSSSPLHDSRLALAALSGAAGSVCRLVGGAAVAVALAACGAGPPDGTSEPRRPNIVLYVVDTVRADRLGVYGYEKPTSPRLDAFAAGAVLFENAYAQSSWTRPAVASLFTGLLPPAHRTVGRRSVLPEDADTLAEILAANGYEGLGLVRNPNVGRAFGFAQGFTRFRSEDRERDETMLDRVRLWLDERQSADGPFFLFLHAIDPHGPYDPAPEFEEMFEADGAPAHYRTVRYLLGLNRGEVEPEPGTAEALSRLYDAEVAQNDRAFGELLDELSVRGLDEDTAVIYVSDHGEEFAEHGRWEHGLSLYEEVLRVPLVMRLPGVPPRRVEAPAQHVDVLPTLLGYLGIEAPPNDGRNLLAARRRGDDPPDVYTHLDVDGHRAASVMRGHYKLVLPQSPSQGTKPMLFDLDADPGELENLASERPDIVERMLGLLTERNLADEVESAEEIEDDQLDEDVRRRLRALGYVD
ncbi:MAG: sulfatase [Acidobacteriota bacterium]|nr:sulfatase [Acidobacteriota bacterium]